VNISLIYRRLSQLLAKAIAKVKTWQARKKIATLALILGLFITAYFGLHQCALAIFPDVQPQIAQRRQIGIPVSEIAREVTVRIITNPGAGSGAIIGRRDNIYTVLTNEHVVANRSDNKYTVLTADGMSHNGRWMRSPQFGSLDLAIVQFNSDRNYQVATFGDSNNLSVGDVVYAAGYPNWYWVNSNNIEDTRNWGLRAYRLTTGQVGMIADRSLKRGYQLGYTNEIEQGMSGGPVLNQNGELIAINGRLKFPPQGIDVYAFADGSLPSQKLFQQMEALSWAIPVATFEQIAQK
jgi:serine protease Do